MNKKFCLKSLSIDIILLITFSSLSSVVQTEGFPDVSN